MWHKKIWIIFWTAPFNYFIIATHFYLQTSSALYSNDHKLFFSLWMFSKWKSYEVNNSYYIFLIYCCLLQNYLHYSTYDPSSFNFFFFFWDEGKKLKFIFFVSRSSRVKKLIEYFLDDEWSAFFFWCFGNWLSCGLKILDFWNFWVRNFFNFKNS